MEVARGMKRNTILNLGHEAWTRLNMPEICAELYEELHGFMPKKYL
jgi:hypothetical protein